MSLSRAISVFRVSDRSPHGIGEAAYRKRVARQRNVADFRGSVSEIVSLYLN
jgi:hypothetical protein